MKGTGAEVLATVPELQGSDWETSCLRALHLCATQWVSRMMTVCPLSALAARTGLDYCSRLGCRSLPAIRLGWVASA